MKGRNKMKTEKQPKLKRVRTNEQMAMTVSWISIVINILLSAFKLVAGIVGNSSAMIADAVHTISDAATTGIVMVGIKLSNRASDKDHQYGHERFECVAAIILSVVLFLVGVGIGNQGLQKVLNVDAETIAIPGMVALIAAIASIFIKEAMYWYTRIVAKKINSTALMADAWHHRSDGLSSIGSFIGIGGAMLGFPILDPLAAIVICIFILKVSYDIFREAISKMTDKACDETTVEEIAKTALAQENVLGIDKLQTRIFGDKIYIDIEIQADGNLTLYEAHAIAEQVHDAIEAQIPNVKHCMVHVNPN